MNQISHQWFGTWALASGDSRSALASGQGDEVTRDLWRLRPRRSDLWHWRVMNLQLDAWSRNTTPSPVWKQVIPTLPMQPQCCLWTRTSKRIPHFGWTVDRQQRPILRLRHVGSPALSPPTPDDTRRSNLWSLWGPSPGLWLLDIQVTLQEKKLFVVGHTQVKALMEDKLEEILIFTKFEGFKKWWFQTFEWWNFTSNISGKCFWSWPNFSGSTHEL